MKKIILLLAIFIFSTEVYAFKWNKCRKGIRNLFHHTFVTGTSTTQFLSSWGPCSMIGATSQEKQQLFIATSLDKIKVDAAIGSGEYLTVLSQLYGCNTNGSEIFSQIMQNNFSMIFNNKGKEPEQVYKNINVLINTNPRLIQSCYVKT